MAFPLILYSSETGTAEDVAYKLHKTLGGDVSGVRVSSLDSDNFRVVDLPAQKGVVVFIVSTTGDGEVPATMQSFWQFLLRKSLPADSLSGVSVAVFGLGDSSYDKYNAAARKLSTRLKQLGAKEVIPIGLGDDQATYGYLSALNPWTVRLCETLTELGHTSLSSPKLQLSDSQSPAAFEYLIDAIVTNSDTDLSISDSVFSLKPKVARSRFSFAPPAHCKLKPDASPLLARVVSNTRQTASSWNQEVRHIVLDISASLDRAECLAWPLAVAGDVATVHPRNPSDIVSRAVAFIAAANVAPGRHLWTADTMLRIRPRSSDHRGQGQGMAMPDRGRKNRIRSELTCTLHDLCALHLDLCGVPRRSFFEGLASLAEDKEERGKLLELCSPEGTDLFFEYCVRERRTYLEVLGEFRSVRVPLERLLELVPPLQPRHYSIAGVGMGMGMGMGMNMKNPSSEAPDADVNSDAATTTDAIVSDYAGNACELHLCAAVVERVTPYGRKRKGVCSSYLAGLVPGELAPLWVRSGAFKSPPTNVPVLCVGPGTGVAPMRAVLQEMAAAVAASPTALAAPTILFFGCRKQSQDFLFGDEWRAIASCAATTSSISSTSLFTEPDCDAYCDPNRALAMTTAFSQDGPTNATKTYVQDKIRLHGSLVWRLLQAGGVLLVSGSAKRMPRDVRRAICDVVEKHGGMQTVEADRYVQRLETTKRYIVEAWS